MKNTSAPLAETEDFGILGKTSFNSERTTKNIVCYNKSLTIRIQKPAINGSFHSRNVETFGLSMGFYRFLDTIGAKSKDTKCIKD